MTYALALLLALVALLTWQQSRRPLGGKAWQLLRSVWPSWRFFEDIEAGPSLSFRLLSPSGAGEWCDALERPPPRWALWLNGPGNLALLQHSLVDQLVDELHGIRTDRAPALVPYRLVQLLVEAGARARGAKAGDRYQFRVVTEGDATLLFASPEHVIGAVSAA